MSAAATRPNAVRKRKAKKPWRDPHDWYCEDAEPVESLFDHWQFQGSIYDPACGRGNIPEVAKRRGYDSYGTDLIDRGYEDIVATFDFLDAPSVIGCAVNIVTNPPYGYQKGICEAFIRRALTLATRSVAVLVPTGFLHSINRNAFFRVEHPPTQICYLSKRTSMPPGAKIAELGKMAFKGGKTNFVWIIWDLIDPTPLPPAFLPARGIAR